MKMETAVCSVHCFSFFSSSNSSISLSDTKLSITKHSLSAHPISSSAIISYAHKHKSPPSSSKPKTVDNSRCRHRTGLLEPREKNEKLNLDVSPHRAVAAVRLMRIELGGAFADLLNEEGKGSGDNEMAYVERSLGFRTKDLDKRDLRLVTEIVGGTIRWRRYLDYVLLSLCHDERTFRNIEPLLLQILRVGCYEILKLEMPTYAVVDENVKLAKYALRPGAGNMVNGILRKLVSMKDNNSLPLPKLDGDDRMQARALATIYSHPVWMVRRWTSCLGQEAAVKLMMWNNTDPSFSLRANSGKGFSRDDLIMKLNMLKVPHEPSLHLDDFVRIRSGMQMVIQNGFLKEGLCSVQDESAGLAVSILDPQPGDCIIDCCAAPGGKTLFMASCLRGQGRISAIDVNKGRLRILGETAKLQCLDDVITCIHDDLRSFADENQSTFEKVLLDVPCSGLGVLSKRPDLRWNRRLEDMEELKKLQDELLDAACKLVGTDGVLVYSTCSIDPEENEERIAAFLLRHPVGVALMGVQNSRICSSYELLFASLFFCIFAFIYLFLYWVQEFQVDPVHRYVPSEFVTEHGFFRSCPVKHSMDGAFAARLVRW